MKDYEQISVRTCEDLTTNLRPGLVAPHYGEPATLFRLNDPFGLRCAIMPLFLVQHDGDLQGLGTCFSLDPWGSFCTADHVISDYRKGVPDGGLLAALFSYGLVYGTVGFNMTETFGKIIAARSLVVPYDNPLSFLHGQTSVKQLDLAFLSVEHPPQRDLKTLPIKSRAPFPALGDTVVAIGFPEIETVEGQFENVRTRLSEGMFAAYGIVTAIHIEGRDSATPTPVFEVEANWPSGMSGGPVFNRNGEVIGVVSRSIQPDEGQELGTGWAILLGALPVLERWVPTLDKDNPRYRRCWVAYRPSPWELGGASNTEKKAMAIAAEKGEAFQISFGAWEIGTNNFIISSSS